MDASFHQGNRPAATLLLEMPKGGGGGGIRQKARQMVRGWGDYMGRVPITKPFKDCLPDDFNESDCGNLHSPRTCVIHKVF